MGAFGLQRAWGRNVTKWQKMRFPFPSPLPSGRRSCAASKKLKKKKFPPDPFWLTWSSLSAQAFLGGAKASPLIATSHFAALPGQAGERMEKRVAQCAHRLNLLEEEASVPLMSPPAPPEFLQPLDFQRKHPEASQLAALETSHKPDFCHPNYLNSCW